MGEPEILNCYHSFSAPKNAVLVFDSALCVQTHMERWRMCQKPEVSRVKQNKVWSYKEVEMDFVKLWTYYLCKGVCACVCENVVVFASIMCV